MNEAFSGSSNDVLSALGDYDVSPTRGFVPELDPPDALPEAFAPWDLMARALPVLIRDQVTRRALSSLPVLNPLTLIEKSQQERALLILTVFANAWVWGEAQLNLRLPACLSMPLCSLASLMQRPPITHYGCISLNNWRRLDATKAVSADNACIQVRFLGGIDENWFFVASLGVELEGVPLILAIESATHASRSGSDQALADKLVQFNQAMPAVLHALERVREWCDPAMFYKRVRPYLAG